MRICLGSKGDGGKFFLYYCLLCIVLNGNLCNYFSNFSYFQFYYFRISFKFDWFRYLIIRFFLGKYVIFGYKYFYFSVIIMVGMVFSIIDYFDGISI